MLQRAFLANGDLEAAYFDWAGALARVRGESSYPNSNLQLGFDYMFSQEKMKAWDRTTLSASFDPAMMLQWPGKVKKAGQVALDVARAKAARFEQAKFELQQRVLDAWWQYVLTAEKVRIQYEQVVLLKMLVDATAQRLRAGGPLTDLLKAQTEAELAANELQNLQSELTAMRAMLNGMMARPADAPLPPPDKLPEARPIPATNPQLIAVAVDRNPELAALAAEVRGRQDALELARLAYIPDFNPQFSITGSASQAVGSMLNLPTNLVRIKSSIEEAKAMLRGTEAMARQTRSDRAAQFVATLVALRNNERQVVLFDSSILRLAREALRSAQATYSSGTIVWADLIDSQRVVLTVRLMIAQARMDRERRLVELERLAGLDIESLAAKGAAKTAATRPAETTQP